MGKSDKAAHRKLAGAGPGRPPAKPGKQVSRFKRQTVAATEASRVEGARGIAMSTVARIAVCLKFASGEIIDFSCRRLLLLMIVNTITTMAPAAATKGLNAHVLRKAGCTKISVPRTDATGNPTFVDFEVPVAEPADYKTHREEGGKAPAAGPAGTVYQRGPHGPSMDELANATTAWLKANRPDVLYSKVEAEFDRRGFLIVWTPPYCPKFQPIELLWGAAKQRASGMYEPGRNLAQTRLDLRMGFYGGTDAHGHVWPLVNIAGCYDKAEGEMNKWIAADKRHVADGLHGTITDLKGAGAWTSTPANCLNITDMEVPVKSPAEVVALTNEYEDEEIGGFSSSGEDSDEFGTDDNV